MSTTLLQPAAFLALVYGGILAGLLYDFFRIPRLLFDNRFILALLDVLFCVCGVSALALALLFATGGTLRPYLLLGFLIGFMVEQWSVTSLFMQAFYWLKSKFMNF